MVLPVPTSNCSIVANLDQLDEWRRFLAMSSELDGAARHRLRGQSDPLRQCPDQSASSATTPRSATAPGSIAASSRATTSASMRARSSTRASRSATLWRSGRMSESVRARSSRTGSASGSPACRRHPRPPLRADRSRRAAADERRDPGGTSPQLGRTRSNAGLHRCRGQTMKLAVVRCPCNPPPMTSVPYRSPWGALRRRRSVECPALRAPALCREPSRGCHDEYGATSRVAAEGCSFRSWSRAAATIEVRDAPIVDVLRAIGEQAGLIVTIEGEAGDRISRSLHGGARERGDRVPAARGPVGRDLQNFFRRTSWYPYPSYGLRVVAVPWSSRRADRREYSAEPTSDTSGD